MPYASITASIKPYLPFSEASHKMNVALANKPTSANSDFEELSAIGF